MQIKKIFSFSITFTSIRLTNKKVSKIVTLKCLIICCLLPNQTVYRGYEHDSLKFELDFHPLCYSVLSILRT